MIGYKGFDKNFKCKDFQFEVGKTYKHDGELNLCKSGFHFCENPLAVFTFYPPADSRFALVEVSGKVISAGDKSCTDELNIAKELSLDELIAAATNTCNYSAAATSTGSQSAATNTSNRSVATNTGKWSAATNTGDCSVAINTGNRSVATNTGDCSIATNTGDWSAATNTGKWSAACVAGEQSLAVAIGKDSKAKGALGCWLTLAEWRDDHIIDVQTFKVDGVQIQADTFYTLKDGKPVKVDD